MNKDIIAQRRTTRRYVTIILAFLSLTCGNPDGSQDPKDSNFSSDPNQPADPAASLSEGLVNGSRLRHRYIAAEDGTVAPAPLTTYFPLFDTQLGVECGFFPAEDGKLRCRPNFISFSYSTDFLDSNCTQRVAIYLVNVMTYSATVNENPTKYASEEVVGAHPIFHISEVTPRPANVFSMLTGSCVANAIPAGAKLYLVGVQAPPTDFVAATFKN